MKICVLENDVVDPDVCATYPGYGAMFERLFAKVVSDWEFDFFKTCHNQFPSDYHSYDAVLLTGSRADSFSNEPWIVTLREHVKHLIEKKTKMLGICFGHQLIALCLGSPVARAPQGWGLGCMTYTWNAATIPNSNSNRKTVSLLASHQDQVLELPPHATLLASSEFCPIAAFTLDNHIFCVQAHPEFDTRYCAQLLDKRRTSITEAHYTSSYNSLTLEHDGEFIASSMVAFLQNNTH
jgi:GMP synthase-like glutamine amidotransferase